jgi:hypothetical protein
MQYTTETFQIHLVLPRVRAHSTILIHSEKPHIRKQKKYRNEKPKPDPPADAGLFRHAQHAPHGAF